MELEFYCPRWGSEKLLFETFISKVKDAGYDGVEMSFPLDESERIDLVEQLKAFDLKLIAQHWETADEDFLVHKINYEKRLRNLAATNPVFINSQTGKDYYTYEQNLELIHIADKVASETGVKVIHETHRGKFSFAAHITKQFLEKLPGLRICLDISHWYCVAETFLDDQAEAVNTAISRTDHIHSRVGFTEGPQIMDPRAEENQVIVDTHISLWQKVIREAASKDFETFTITPEFGAPPYQQLFPYTKQAIYSQWEVNVYMMHLLKTKLNTK